MPEDELVINRVRSTSTDTPGRAINIVRTHEFLIDEPTHLGGPGEEITPADAFLSGVSACGALMVQGRARTLDIPLRQIDVSLEARRHRRDTSTFTGIDMLFRVSGPTREQALELIDYYQHH